MKMKINVGIFFGGKSTEHEVSIISALQAIENLDNDKYNVIPVYMSKLGEFYYSEDGSLIDSNSYKNINELLSKCIKVSLVRDAEKTFLRNVKNEIFSKKINLLIDVAFPIVHGTNVEDGNLQGFFHTLNLPIVGPDCLSAAVSMDKFVMKKYCQAIDVPVIEGLRFDKIDFKNNKIINAIEEKLNYPVIVKPVNLGSSIGIKKANNKNELQDALELAFSFASVVLVEKAIVKLKEINCAVLGDKFNCECSALEEPFGKDEILSFADKYLSGNKSSNKGLKFGDKFSSSKIANSGSKGGMASLQRRVPAILDKETEDLIKNFAIKTFKYIGCSGVARIDFIIDEDTNEIFVNEINPIPGSLSFYLFEPIGMEYKVLLDKLIQIALKSFRYESELNFTFENNLLK